MIRWDDPAIAGSFDELEFVLRHGSLVALLGLIAWLGYLIGNADGVELMWDHLETLHAADTVAVHSHCRVETGRYLHTHPDSLWGLVVCPSGYEGSAPLNGGES